jgi:quercetin dioxygenase-like cupin family protein
MSNKPKTVISCVSNIFTRMMRFEKIGDYEAGHSHVFDHLTLLAKGSLRVVAGDGKPTIFKAPHMIFIKKDIQHELTALEDDTVAFCIHALRDGDNAGDLIDPRSLPDGIYPEFPKEAKSLTN